MILACHVILSAYGFWLPNDPRGSWSDFVRSYELYRNFGPATKVDTQRSVASNPHDRATRLAAKRSLTYPAVRFNGTQARCIAHAFAQVAIDWHCPIHAFAMLPDHGHVLIGRPPSVTFDRFISRLKEMGTKALTRQGMHPLSAYAKPGRPKPSPWAHDWWKVFLDSDEDVHRAIDYVKRNPRKSGFPDQRWSFVRPY
jgi:REP element-mobilizing transposase RayT